MALVVLLVLSHAPVRVAAQSPGGGTAAEQVDRPWPRQVTSGTYTIRVYQPQLDKWDGTALEARAAVSVEQPSAPQPDFGVAWITARTEVDRVNRLVALDKIQITKASFPGAAGKADWTYLEILRKSLPKGVRTVALDRLQASLAITEAQSRQQKAEPVKNDPPRILFSPSPALLVLVDDKPVLRQVEGSKLLRVINTWALVLVDGSSGKYYLRVLGRWAEAGAVEGPWAISARPPASLETARQSLAKSQQVNLLDDPGPGLKEAAGQGRYPTIHVSTVPAELIQTDGQPAYESIGGTELLHVKNSSANILVDQKTADHYVLLAGRWFRGKSLERGPWEYVDHDKLPPDFAKIPENHPRGAVLASVAGTPQAQEALIDNSIPQTAEVNRQTATLQATYDGSPQLKPIEDTPLHYVVNSPIPVIQADASTYYALQNGVWFVGTIRERPVDRGDVRAGGDLHHPGQLAAALRHLRVRVRIHAHHGRDGVHAGILRDGRGADERGRVRHRLCLPRVCRQRVVSVLPHLLRLRSRLRLGRVHRIRGRRRGRRGDLGRRLGLLPGRRRR